MINRFLMILNSSSSFKFPFTLFFIGMLYAPNAFVGHDASSLRSKSFKPIASQGQSASAKSQSKNNQLQTKFKAIESDLYNWEEQLDHSQVKFVMQGIFDKMWKEVDDLENQGLTQSALEKVEEINVLAKQGINGPQIVKTAIYKTKYLHQLNEDGMEASIAYLKEETKLAFFPSKQVLHSILAEQYNRYLSQNRWKIQNRTDIEGEVESDLQRLNVADLIGLINDHYLASIGDERIQKLSISEYNDILHKGENAEDFRKSLWDFLMHRCIDHFSNSQSFVIEPEYKFIMNSKELFTPYKTFIKSSFESQDESSYKYQTILLFQRLLKYKVKERNTDDLIDVDLKRLAFVRNHSVLADKNDLYVAAIKQLESKVGRRYKNAVRYALAEHYYQQGSRSDAQSSLVTQAKQLLEQIVKEDRENLYEKKARHLLSVIGQKSLQILVEAHHIPNQPILVHATYKNVSQLHGKIFFIEAKDYDKFSIQNQKDQLKNLSSYTAIKTFSQKLPSNTTENNFSAEFDMDGLPSGHYVLMMSDRSDFRTEGGAVSLNTLIVGNIAIIQREANEGGKAFVVIDRSTGHPMNGAKVTFYRQKRQSWTKISNAYTDKDGFVYSDLKENEYYRVQVITKSDTFFLKSGFRNYPQRHNTGAQSNTSFFLDRAIYRPGQRIYFKGLLIQKDDEGYPTLAANSRTKITLLDANGQEVKTLELTSNEFGSIHSSFSIPESGLLGSMSLRSSFGGSSYFQVEAYKRPTFEVKLDTIAGSYSLGKQVNMTGKVMAYSGFPISAADVNIRIVRKSQSLYHHWWRPATGGFGGGEVVEIKNTSIQADDKGVFKFDFIAKYDDIVEEDKYTSYRYEIDVEATSPAGETQLTKSVLQMGKAPFVLSTNVDREANKESLSSLKISSRNYNGSEIETTGEIVIHKLISPVKMYQNRLWQKPDTILINKGEFDFRHPHLVYRNEDLIENWTEGPEVYRSDFNSTLYTGLGSTVDEWEPGVFKIMITAADKAGKKQEYINYVTLFDLDDTLIPYNALWWSKQEKESYTPGETAELRIGTAAAALPVLIEIEKNNEVTSSSWLKLERLQKIPIPIDTIDRGNIICNITYVFKNRFYTHSEIIQVPWTDKALDISWETFRDEIQPGANEEWTLKIKGNVDSIGNGELLATMYDASLDAIAKNNWALNPYRSYNYPTRSFSNYMFRASYGRLIANNWNSVLQRVPSSYDRLNWFGYYRYEGMPMKMARTSAMNDQVEVSAMSKEVLESAPESADQAAALPADVGEEKPFVPRKDLGETVFFNPDMEISADGMVTLSFKMKEALTRWRFLGLAHTQDLKFGFIEQEITTEKEHAILPLVPRFVRHGDRIILKATVTNMTATTITSSAVLDLKDVNSGNSLSQELLKNAKQQIVIEPGVNKAVAWEIEELPEDITGLIATFTSDSGDHIDGQQNYIPVLPNKKLITETQAIWVNGKSSKTYRNSNVGQATTSKTMVPIQYNLEMTSHPIWFAIKSLPFVRNIESHCIEQQVNSLFVNRLGQKILKDQPAISAVIKNWEENAGTESELAKNIDVKSVSLAETPWVRAAQDESNQRREISKLMNGSLLQSEEAQIIGNLLKAQNPDGGFPWWEGGRSNTFVTQYVLEQLGHLINLNALEIEPETLLSKMINNAIKYIDNQSYNYFSRLERNKTLDEENLPYSVVQYLYVRSFFTAAKMKRNPQLAFDYFKNQAYKYWTKKSVLEQAQIGIFGFREKEIALADQIVASLKERAIQSEDRGMYWKQSGYGVNLLPIGSQATVISLFSMMEEPQSGIDEMKKWLLSQKQTNRWSTTKATTAAIFALLQDGSQWIEEENSPEISLEGKSVVSKYTEAGTGYFKEMLATDDAKKELEIKNPNSQPLWGATYFQYFEAIDKIEGSSNTPLKVKKQLFIQEQSDTGPKLRALESGNVVSIGDVIVNRISIEVDREMEFIHLEDGRASGLEPVEAISKYKYQDGLGYFENISDTGTHFYFDRLARGKYVFEYQLRASLEGDMVNGIAKIQSMYAPGFASHSDGSRLKVE